MDSPDAYFNKYVRFSYLFYALNYFFQIGNWTLTAGLTPLYESLGVDVRSLNHYRIVTILQAPFIQLEADPNTGIFTLQGYCIDLLDLIQEQLSFIYELYVTPDGQFGSMDGNGVWNGLIGELVMGTFLGYQWKIL